MENQQKKMQEQKVQEEKVKLDMRQLYAGLFSAGASFSMQGQYAESLQYGLN